MSDGDVFIGNFGFEATVWFYSQQGVLNFRESICNKVLDTEVGIRYALFLDYIRNIK